MQYPTTTWTLGRAARIRLVAGLACLFVASAAVALIGWQTLVEPADLTWNRWAFYEWLINYESGFARRGLVGAAIHRWFYGAETVAINHLVFVLGTLFIALVTLQVLRPDNLSPGGALYVLSPAGFVWLGLANQFYYRKEILFYVALLTVAALYRRRPARTGAASATRVAYLAYVAYDLRLVGAVLLCSILLPFVHEAYVFFCGLFFTLVLRSVLADHLPPRALQHALAAFVALNLALFLGFTALKSSPADTASIWQSLSPHARSFAGSEASGAVLALGWSAFYAALLPAKAVLSGLSTYYLFTLALLYVIAAYVYAELSGLRLGEALRDRVLGSNFALVCATFLPLFAIGEDWGRWVFGIATVFMAMIYSRLLLPVDPQLLARWRKRLPSGQAWRGRWLFAGLLLLALTTRLPECCLSGSGGAFVADLADRVKALLHVSPAPAAAAR